MRPEDVLVTHPFAIKNLDELFRLAHLQAFGKDTHSSWRAREIASYHTNGQVPKYVLTYLDRFKI